MLKGRKILVTAGPTYEYLDDIRFIGNKSSGIQGTEIAKQLQKLEADVTLIIGPVNLDLSSLKKVVRVETAVEMNNSVIKEGIKIGSNVIIGAGSVVIRDINDNSKVVGNPAKEI